MTELFKAMLKEEWRIHSSMFGSVLFALFPLIIMFFGAAMAFGIEVTDNVNNVETLVLISHYGFTLLGVGAGGFALSGREVMNRRFGQASLLAYSTRTLPVTEKSILFNYLIKEITYYLFLWVAPFVLGFLAISPFIHLPMQYGMMLVLTLTLSFWLGLSVVFALSTVYVRSRRALVSLIIMIFAGGYIYQAASGSDILKALPTYTIFMTNSYAVLATTALLSAILCLLSVNYAKVDFPTNISRHSQEFLKIEQSLRKNKHSAIIAKDMIDLERSTGGFGKYVFSFILPLVFVIVIIQLYSRFADTGPFLTEFSIFVAIMSSSIYTWLTEYDSGSSYSFFPIKISHIIEGKIESFALLNIMSFIAIAAVAFWKNELQFLLLALVVFISVSAFTLALTVYLGGLRPNIYLLNAKLFIVYIGVLLSVVMALSYYNAVHPYFLLYSLTLLPVAIFIIYLGYRKWDNTEQTGF
jgi:hypothetical protein